MLSIKIIRDEIAFQIISKCNSQDSNAADKVILDRLFLTRKIIFTINKG